MHSLHFEHCICVKSVFNLLQLSDDLIFSFFVSFFFIFLSVVLLKISLLLLFSMINCARTPHIETFFSWFFIGCYSLVHANLIATECTFVFQFDSVESLLCCRKKERKKNNNTLWNRHNDVDNFECGVASSSTYVLISISLYLFVDRLYRTWNEIAARKRKRKTKIITKSI